ENAQYLITQGSRVLAGGLFGSAAWSCRDRDQFIGWSGEARARNLSFLTNNQRFLILPGCVCRTWAVGFWAGCCGGSPPTGRPSTDIRSGWSKPLWSASDFGARSIEPPTGSTWGRRKGGLGRIATPPCACR